MTAWRYEISHFSSHVEIFFQHSKRNFVSPRDHCNILYFSWANNVSYEIQLCNPLVNAPDIKMHTIHFSDMYLVVLQHIVSIK